MKGVNGGVVQAFGPRATRRLPNRQWPFVVRRAVPPLDRKATEALIALLAEVLHVPKSSVRILRGSSGRRKLVAVAGLEQAKGVEILRN